MAPSDGQDLGTTIQQASSQLHRLSIQQGDDGEKRVDKVKAFLDAFDDGPATNRDVETLLDGWNQVRSPLLHTLAAHEVDRLFLRHLTARLVVITGAEPSCLTETNLQRLYRLAKDHLGKCSTATFDSELALLISQSSVTAAALKLLHGLLVLPRGGPSACLTLNAPEIDSCVQDLLQCSNYRPTPPNTRSGPSIYGSRPSLRQSVASESEVTSTDYGSDNRSQAGNESDNPRKRVSSTARTVRQNAISCLSALHEAFPALLFSSWPQLLEVEEVKLAAASSSSALPPGGFGSMGTTPRRPTHSLLTVMQDDSVLSVRLAACQLVMNMFKKAAQKGFLVAGIVEPRATGVRPSFISLSARMGSLIANVRSFLAHLLGCGCVDTRRPLERDVARRVTVGAPIPAPLTECLLRCTKSLVMATSTAKLRRSHADVLREPVIRLSSHSDPSVAIAAFNLLSALNPTAAVPSRNSPRAAASSDTKADTTAVEGLIRKLGDDSLDADVLAKAWSALASFAVSERASLASREVVLLQHVLRHLNKDDQAVRQACIAFTAVMLNGDDSDVQHAQKYIEIVQTAACDRSSLVRTEVAQVIPGAMSLEARCASVERLSLESLKTMETLDGLVKDTEAVARAAAIRALGVLLAGQGSSTKAGGRPTNQLITHAMKLLQVDQDAANDGRARQLSSTPSPLADVALLVRLRASWTLANLAQAISGPDGESLPDKSLHALIKATLPLLADDERVAVNGLRCAGLLLSTASQVCLSMKNSKVSVARHLTLQLNESTNSAKSPKAKWNAVNAISTALSSDDFRDWLSSSQGESQNEGGSRSSTSTSLLSTLTRTLSSQLLSKVFKVKLAAVSGLMKVLDPSSRNSVTSSDLALFTSSLGSALSTIESEISEATFREAQLHGESTRNALIQLQGHLMPPSS